ncbi:MAG TPA: 2'-5' RNA ligase family protein [Luteibacter sp.]|jgi:2'-5' RNA ligase|uniref:2'-5' RNA ligase family protein n=1 Tax=Luteibacter sp. TaxID=1886636 RepID=UPI002F416A0E
MSRTLLALLVPDADPLVGDLRAKLDPAAKLGFGAHITLVYPFYDSDAITVAHLVSLDAAVALHRPLAFSMDAVGTFSSTVWLAPAPDGEIVELVRALERAFPDLPTAGPAHERFVPHLSVARNVRRASDRDTVARVLEERLEDDTVRCQCIEVHVMVREPSRWRSIHRSPLG